MDVASFLLTCTSTLPNAEEISQQLLGGGDDDDEEDEEMEDVEKKNATNTTAVNEDTKPAAASSDPQTTLLQSIQASQQHPTFATTNNNEIIEVSCINPRGKFQLSIYKNGIILTNPKKPEEVIPISNNVSNVIWFRKPEDYKKMKQLAKNGVGGSSGKKDKGIPGHMVLICLEEGVMFRNKPLKQVCFQLPTYPSQSTAEDDNSTQLNEASWWDGLTSSLFTEDEAKKSDIIRVNASMETGKSSNGFVFKSAGEQGSSSTTEGLPFVGCYQGFNDGALFPLKEGLLFFKPPMFVPRSDLASISCGRGAGGSRYVDMEVKLHVSDDNEQEGKKKKKQSDTLEWSNINRDELEGLNNYIHKTLIPAMQADADGTNEKGLDGNSSDDDDDDFAVAEVVNTSDNEEKRPSRAASKSAREINKAALAGGNEDEDSDDDSDEFEEEEDSDDSSDEESVVSEKSDEAGSSSEDEDEEEANDSDGSDYRESKKARVG